MVAHTSSNRVLIHVPLLNRSLASMRLYGIPRLDRLLVRKMKDVAISRQPIRMVIRMQCVDGLIFVQWSLRPQLRNGEVIAVEVREEVA